VVVVHLPMPVVVTLVAVLAVLVLLLFPIHQPPQTLHQLMLV
jgi:hypothetical protein